jgi:hypothetical protein
MTAPATMEALLVERAAGRRRAGSTSPSGTASAALRCAGRGRSVVALGQAARPLLPRGRGADRRPARRRLHPRRRAGHRDAGGPQLRRLVAAPAPGRKPHPQAAAETPACSWPSTCCAKAGGPARFRLASAARGWNGWFAAKRPRLLLSPQTTDRRAPATGWSAAAARSTAWSPSAPTSPTARRAGDAQGQAPPQRRLRGRRLPLRQAKGSGVASLLLGLYGEDGLLHHVGFCSSFKAAERRAWAAELAPLIGGEGFTGNRPTRPAAGPASGRASGSRSARAGGRGALRPGHRRPLPPRHAPAPPAARQAPDQCRCEQLRHPLTPVELPSCLTGPALCRQARSDRDWQAGQRP